MATEDETVQEDGALTELKARRESLAKRRNNVQRTYNSMAPLGWFLPIFGVPCALIIHQQHPHPGSIIWLFAIMYCFLPLALIPVYRQRARQLDTEVQELDFQIDLQQFEANKREARAEKLLWINDLQLRRYYDLNINQNSWVFALGISCIGLGIAVVGTTLFLVLRVAQTPQTQIITAALGAIGAVLSNFVAVIYLKMNTGATENLKVFHSKLVETHQFLLGNLLASRIEQDEKRWETLSQLSLRLMEKEKG
jgi:hypothetical protein